MTEKFSTPKRRGRPAYHPTCGERRQAKDLALCDASDNAIAGALGIDPDTLRKHFADELADGHAQRRRIAIDSLFTAARAGRYGAINALLKMGRSPDQAA